MATQMDIDYALMAGHAYRTTRAEINWIPTPAGWTPFFPVPDDSTAAAFPVGDTGFEAISFKRGTEIVISYAGTDPEHSNPFTTPDGITNKALVDGRWAEQLLQAATYYLDIKAANPGATITFTGHSLGGGLAALMAVFFSGEEAQTFDQAPFALSALNWPNGNNATTLKQRLEALTVTRTVRGVNESAIYFQPEPDTDSSPKIEPLRVHPPPLTAIHRCPYP